MRCMKNVLASLMVFVLCACSNTRLAYNYLDWIITWYLDDYLSLNSRQDDFYEQRLNALLRWHRKDQLVRYSLFVDQLQQDMRVLVSAAVLQERYDSLQQFWRDIMERAAPDCAELLLGLDQDQRLAFYAAGAKKQKELEDRYLRETASERNRRQCAQAEKALKRFVGRLAGPQRVILERWAEALVQLQSLWLENRRTWQRSLQAVLEGNEPDAEKRKRLERLFIEPEYLWTPAYRHAIRQNETATLTMLLDLLGSLTGGAETACAYRTGQPEKRSCQFIQGVKPGRQGRPRVIHKKSTIPICLPALCFCVLLHSSARHLKPAACAVSNFLKIIPQSFSS